MIGRTIGTYEVRALLGVGGMGEVYRARDTRLQRDVALKFLPHSFKDDPERLARFAREARMLAAVSHPNVASIYGVEDADGVEAIVLELVEGETLSERLSRPRTGGGGLPLTDVMAVGRQVRTRSPPLMPKTSSVAT